MANTREALGRYIMFNTFARSLILMLAAVMVGICIWLTIGRHAMAVNGSGTRSKPTQPIDSYLKRSRVQQSEENKQRLREGTKITNRLGRFRQAGDRATFVTENNIERCVCHYT